MCNVDVWIILFDGLRAGGRRLFMTVVKIIIAFIFIVNIVYSK